MMLLCNIAQILSYFKNFAITITITNGKVIDTELVSIVVSRLHGGKAPEIAGLTSEHLVYRHPSVSVVLCKLFKLIMQRRHVPAGFTLSFIVPIPKIKKYPYEVYLSY